MATNGKNCSENPEICVEDLGQDKFRLLYEGSAYPIFLVDEKTGGLLEANRAASALYGYSRAEFLRMNLEELAAAPPGIDLTSPPPSDSVSVRYHRKKSGGTFPTELACSKLDIRGQTFRVCSVRDITKRLSIEEKLRQKKKRFEYLAYHDSLTGLPNRLLFQDRLEHAIAQARRSGGAVALLFLDLDRFKNINDSFGHVIGDKLLIAVSGLLRKIVRDSDTLARLGGDEFVIILEQFTNPQTPSLVAHQILKLFTQPIRIEGFSFHVTTSIGITIFPADANDAVDLMRCADSAMYQAKETGRNAFHYYTMGRSARTKELLLLENNLRCAIEKDQFVLHYQPLVDLSSGRLLGAEALVRWQHPELGLVAPANFIPLAEDSGMIASIGEWVLRTACRQTRSWHKKAGDHPRVNVNISAWQFRQANLVESVAKILQETDFDPRLLELEITESTIMKNVKQAVEAMNGLNALGVRLAIDDFGSGYSSLNHLKSFPLNHLKIDRTFIKNITQNSRDAAIANAVIALAHTMNLGVVAEGIETPEQVRFLQEKKCNHGQGFFFGRPVPAEQFLRFLEE